MCAWRRCEPDVPCLCLSEAFHDAGFSHWAARHGLGFDYGEAWRSSGAAYWTGDRVHLLFDRDWRYVSGQPIPDDRIDAQLDVRDTLAAKVKQFYAAYLADLPPAHPRALSLPCGCYVQQLDEDDEL